MVWSFDIIILFVKVFNTLLEVLRTTILMLQLCIAFLSLSQAITLQGMGLGILSGKICGTFIGWAATACYTRSSHPDDCVLRYASRDIECIATFLFDNLAFLGWFHIDNDLKLIHLWWPCLFTTPLRVINSWCLDKPSIHNFASTGWVSRGSFLISRAWRNLSDVQLRWLLSTARNIAWMAII